MASLEISDIKTTLLKWLARGNWQIFLLRCLKIMPESLSKPDLWKMTPSKKWGIKLNTGRSLSIFQILWNALPPFMQIVVSRIYAELYETSFSRFFIRPFCRLHSLSEEYLSLFVSAQTSTSDYLTFQDFFTRRLKEPLVPEADFIWPCEGYVCEQSPISNLKTVNVKGEWRDLRGIFDWA